MPSEEEILEAAIRKASETFTRLRAIRHETGEEKYGRFTFVQNDVVRMMLEELADLCNYAEYQAAKLLCLQVALEEDPELNALTRDGSISIGVQAFKGTKEGW